MYRNRAKRILRSLCLNQENKLLNGKYVFVAKNEIFTNSFINLQNDFELAIKKINSKK